MFLIEKIIKYRELNKEKKCFEVVFPYDLEFQNKNRRLPKYYHDECVEKKCTVDDIYDTFEEAKKKKEEKNYECLMDNLGLLPLEISKMSVKLTEDMVVEKEINKERIMRNILIYKKEILSYIGSLLTKDEKKILNPLISNKDCDNCTYWACKQKEFICDKWENDELYALELLRRKEN